jgi:hypothetical protein
LTSPNASCKWHFLFPWLGHTNVDHLAREKKITSLSSLLPFLHQLLFVFIFPRFSWLIKVREMPFSQAFVGL